MTLPAAMRRALDLAAEAAALGEVPVGAVVVDSRGTIVAAAANRTLADRDPSAHAEMLAIRMAATAVGGWRLVGSTLYVTQEPCPMCAGAIVNARVERVVFGCRNPKAGAARSLYELLEVRRLNHRVVVEEGVLAEAAAELLKGFFATLRR